jgi:alpha-beta hydrolase superfamily lysophospholipase
MKRRIGTLSLALLMATTSFFQCNEAEAFWWMFKKKSKDAAQAEKKRQARNVAGAPVGLVPGNPPALYWKPSGSAKAALLCLHELGMHSGVFDDLGKRMSAQGIAVYAIDLRGFGGWQDMKTPEARMDLDKTFEDVKGSLEIIRKLNPGIPVFVLGEAMGGALALQAAARFPELVQGVISAAPGGEHFRTVANYMTIGSKVATMRANKDSGYAETLMEMATPREDLREALKSDERVRLDVTPREMMACQFFMYKTKKFAREIKNTPVMIVHGEKDGESKPIGSEKVYKALATDRKKYVSLTDGDHYVFEDTKVNDKAFEAALSWIDTHAAPSP